MMITNYRDYMKAKRETEKELTDEEHLIHLESLKEEKDLDKWNNFTGWDKFDWNKITIKKCIHLGEVNIFNLIPITCHDLKTDDILKIIKEKNIKSWLILEIGCILNINIDKLDIKFYFAPIDDYSVPSFETANKIIEFIHENSKQGNILISCMGGHGRTGTILAIWAGLNGIENPIQHIRKVYCEEAIETISQEMFVNLYLKYLKSL